MKQDLMELLALSKGYEKELPALRLPEEHPGASLSGNTLARWIDHTLLKPEAAPEQVEELCDEARRFEFATVCVNPIFVPLSRRLLEGSPVLVCTVVGFPLGATLTAAKVEETRIAIAEGAQEIDMVIPVGMLKSGAYGMVEEDIRALGEVSHKSGALVKVILEMALLSQQEKIAGCLISQKAGADFVKTSTGFGPGGATVEDVELMRRVVGPHMGVKAAGGVRTLADAASMLNAGATRLGTSAGVKIMQEAAAAQRTVAEQ